MIFRESFPTVAGAVIGVVHGAGHIELDAPTPCRDFDLRALINHVTGTTSALARVGRRLPLDADDPYGARLDPSRGDWQHELASNISDLAAVWSKPEAWEGTVDMGGGENPAVMIGEMAVAEILLHGWDLARATGQDLTVPEPLARELLRSVEQTAELGRSMGAYGPVVTVRADSGAFERALAASGRDPAWASTVSTIGA